MTDSPISLRLPEEVRADLDRAAKLTRRSRAWLVREALAKHLAEIVRTQTSHRGEDILNRIKEIQTSAMTDGPPRSKEDIDTEIEHLRRET